MGHALESVTRWTRQRGYPRDRIEILVVSDGAEPDLETRIQVVLGAQDRIVRHAAVDEWELLDHGARRARGNLLVLTEPHVLAEPDFLCEMVAFLKSTGHAGACAHSEGRYDNAIGRQAYRQFTRDFRIWSAPGNGGKVLIHGFAIDRRAYLEAGGFPPQYRGFAGAFLARRLEQLGYSLGYASRARVCHVFFRKMGEHMARVEEYVTGQLAHRRDHPEEECGPEFAPRRSVSGADMDPASASHIAGALLRHVPRALARGDVAFLGTASRSGRELAWRRLNGPVAVASWRRWLAILRTHCWRWHPDPERLDRAYQSACLRTTEWVRLRFLADAARGGRRAPRAVAGGVKDGGGHPRSIMELPPDRLVGFHDLEVWDGRVFRWSFPTAGLWLALPAGGCRVVLDTGAFRDHASLGLRVFVDGGQLPARSVQAADGQITLTISPEPSRAPESFLFWTCRPLTPSGQGEPDPRRLGLPLVGVSLVAEREAAVLGPKTIQGA